jgi:NAD(P)-dependent dehydrogenase (short-subunit alcohol dehydrogenase family)
MFETSSRFAPVRNLGLTVRIPIPALLMRTSMRRRGFIPYGPSRAATESLSHIMAQDLGSSGVTVNMLLPGGATTTGMIPDEVPASMRPQILLPDVMAEPVVFLCSDEAHDVNDQRVVAKEFARWKEERRS